jgi:hypothetical protein
MMAGRARLTAAAALVLLGTSVATAWPATLSGTPGADTLSGGPAADVLSGFAGDDRLRGGGGDDVLDGGPGNDDLAGGAGTDAASYGGAGAVRVTIDDLADDGAAGEHDNVQVDVEDVYGGNQGDVLTGSAGSNTLDGGAGPDTLTGAAGADDLFGALGDDRLFARDGVADGVDCGDGFDTAIVDERDHVSGCEAVDRRPAVPRVEFALAHAWVWSAGSTRPLRLKLRDVEPPAAAFTVRCSGAGCPARLHRGRRAPRHDLLKLFRGVQLAPGAKVEIRGTAPRRIGRTARFRIRRGTWPVLSIACSRANSRRAMACPDRG